MYPTKRKSKGKANNWRQKSDYKAGNWRTKMARNRKAQVAVSQGARPDHRRLRRTVASYVTFDGYGENKAREKN